MAGFSLSNPGYVALLAGGEKVPAGWLGPVAPCVQDCFFINENGQETPGGWGRAGGQPHQPGASDRVIYFNGPGGQLRTVGYAGGSLQLYASGAPGAGRVRLVVTRVTTGEVLYDQTQLQDHGDSSRVFLLHDVAFPVFAAWRLDITGLDSGIGLNDFMWT